MSTAAAMPGAPLLAAVLPREIERVACRTFRILACRLEASADRSRHAAALSGRYAMPSRKPAFARSEAGHYHRTRGDRVLIEPGSTRERIKSAPQVTVEALVWSAREGGFAALRSRANQCRLRTLSPVQIEETRQRLRALKAAGKIPGKRA